MNIADIERFADMLKNSRSVVFFGGAGVSTESGVKDYRSEDGIYNSVKEYGVSPEEILSHDFFFSRPKIFFDFYYKYFLLPTPEPNRAHCALAKLEKAGKISAVITQNIDGLHQKAGSRNVLELHGTTAKNRCVNCGHFASFDDMRSFQGKTAVCPVCGGLLKPDVVLYGEQLDPDVVNATVDAIASADLMIIGGTSLAVYPAASFIGYFRGNNTVLINKGETPYDSRADLVFRDPIGDVMSEALKLITE